MKELKNHNPDKDSIQDIRPVKTKKKLIGQLKYIPGLSLFKLNVETLEIEKVIIESVFDINKKKSSFAVQFEKGHLYCVALNLKNAKKKFAKMLNG